MYYYTGQEKPYQKQQQINFKTMIIYKTDFGSYRIEALLNGYIFKRYYIGYTLATAKRLFKHDLKQHRGR